MCSKEGLKLQGNWKGREKGLKEEYLRAEAQLGLLLGWGNILFCMGLGVGIIGGFPPPFRKFFKNKSAFLRV